MAAGTFQWYDLSAKYLMNGTVNLATATIQAALVTSTYTPSFGTDAKWADISANEIANGNGYTTGGQALASQTLTAITNGFRFSSSNLVWNATGTGIPQWRRCVFYVNGTVNGVVNPVIGTFLGDATPADIPTTAAGVPLTIACPANGWGDLTHS